MMRQKQTKKNIFLYTSIMLCVGLLIPSSLVHAAPGELDTSFDPQAGANGTVQAIIVQDDGKIVIGGDFTDYNGTTVGRIARLNADGSIDATFNSGGVGADAVINDFAVQDDGKIIIVGQLQSYNGTTVGRIARLNTDGSIDATFNSGGAGASAVINDIALLHDGDMYITGNFSQYNGVSGAGRLVRLNADGTEDTGFNNGTGLASAGSALVVQDDGKLLVGGNFTSYNGTGVTRLIRVNTDGTLDGTFSVGTGPDALVSTVALQDDGKIVIGGSFTDYNGTTVGRIARLNADGSIDATFNSGGVGANLSVTKVLVQENQKLLMIGNFSSYNGDGSIVRIARLLTDGSIDTAFRPAPAGAGASGVIETITLQPDGQILIGGAFTAYDSVSRVRIARLDGDHVPAVVTLTPADDATSVSVTTDLTIEFDEAVTIGTGSIVVKKTSDDSTVATIDVTSGQVTGGGTDTIVIDTGVTLDPSVGYYVLIDEGTFEDAASNPYPGMDIKTTWNFTTASGGDTTDPTITTLTPADNATDVSVTTNLTMEFDEDVAVGTGNIVIRKVSDDSIVETIDVTSGQVTGGGTDTIVINPSVTLDAGVQYYVTVATTAFDDLAGNSFAGITTSTAWNFTTAPETPTVDADTDTEETVNRAGARRRAPVAHGVAEQYAREAESILSNVQCPVFTTYWQVGDSSEGVKQIQAFLTERGVFSHHITGFYGPITDAAVKAFQVQYADEILTPWGLTGPTGRWYQSTRHKANELVGCSEKCIVLDNGVEVCD